MKKTFDVRIAGTGFINGFRLVSEKYRKQANLSLSKFINCGYGVLIYDCNIADWLAENLDLNGKSKVIKVTFEIEED